MSRKPKLKPDDPDQYKRFLETAKAVEADEDLEAFEKAFSNITKPRRTSKEAGE